MQQLHGFFYVYADNRFHISLRFDIRFNQY